MFVISFKPVAGNFARTTNTSVTPDLINWICCLSASLNNLRARLRTTASPTFLLVTIPMRTGNSDVIQFAINANATQTSPIIRVNVSGGTELFRIHGDNNYNLAIGNNAGGATTGFNNTAIGSYALSSNTGSSNVAVGRSALSANLSGFSNVGMGEWALGSNTNGYHNSAIGASSLAANTTGDANTAIGSGALNANIGGVNNSALGYQALNFNTSGDYNTAVGNGALLVTSTGRFNTGLGTNAGAQFATGDYNIGIGYMAGPAAASAVSNQLYIANSSGTPTIYGDLTNKRVGINTTAPGAYQLYVNGSLAVNSATADKTGGGAWGVLSDARLKTVEGSYNYGLNEIMQLDPVRYHYSEGNPLQLDSSASYIGFIAQDVQGVIPEAVSVRDDGYLRFEADPVLWAMVNAIQEQQAQITSLGVQINTSGVSDNTPYWHLNSGGDLTTTRNVTLAGLVSNNASIGTITSDHITVIDLEVTGLLSAARITTGKITPLGDLTVELAGHTGASQFAVKNDLGKIL